MRNMPNIKIKWGGSSVSGLVVIAGIISIILSQIFNNSTLLLFGFIFVLLGLIGAIIMTVIINQSRRR